MHHKNRCFHKIKDEIDGLADLCQDGRLTSGNDGQNDISCVTHCGQHEFSFTLPREYPGFCVCVCVCGGGGGGGNRQKLV